MHGRVQVKGTGVWTDVFVMASSPVLEGISFLSADNDGGMDMFMTATNGQWGNGYQAKHVGVGEWRGTRETVSLAGRNVIADVFAGSDDASILLLTDDANGDALFVDDIFTALPDGIDAQARIAKIDEIHAGAGDDVVDLTSQQFEYVGGGMTVHGGLGDDVIWANKGDNWLFGDAGNDRIVGALDNDIIVGGAGDDNLHGGGGSDVFCFGGEWGNDKVAQLVNGNVLLWFDDIEQNDLSLSADANGNAVLSCANGSVTLLGVKNTEIAEAFAASNSYLREGLSLRFGDDGREQYSSIKFAGAFNAFTSEKIFEERDKGMLA